MYIHVCYQTLTIAVGLTHHLPHVPSKVRYDFPKISFLTTVIMIHLGVVFNGSPTILYLMVACMDNLLPQIETMWCI